MGNGKFSVGHVESIRHDGHCLRTFPCTVHSYKDKLGLPIGLVLYRRVWQKLSGLLDISLSLFFREVWDIRNRLQEWPLSDDLVNL